MKYNGHEKQKTSYEERVEIVTYYKWLTDGTEMKYGASGKAYLSAIRDLADKSIVSFDIAHENHPDAKHIKSIQMY